MFFFFFDGAACQLKQRFTLREITQLETNLSWNFSATSHGKGAVDGIGGTLKRDLNSTILSKNIAIKNTDSLCDVAVVLKSEIN